MTQKSSTPYHQNVMDYKKICVSKHLGGVRVIEPWTCSESRPKVFKSGQVCLPCRGGGFLKKKQKNDPLEEELSEEDVMVPLDTLVLNRRTPVNIWDMARYSDVFGAIETTVLQVWQDTPKLRDRDVLAAYTLLLKDFDHQPESSLASEVAKSVKASLIFRARDKEKQYTYGEVLSCVSKLVRIAKDHHSPDGRGYLKWVRTFFEGNMPTNLNDILDYMFKNEM